ncbi:MAG: hypothetical protein ABIK62_00900 [candidate division WOR-3 bacterium]
MSSFRNGVGIATLAIALLATMAGAQSWQDFYPKDSSYWSGWLTRAGPTKYDDPVWWNNGSPDSTKRGWCDFDISSLSFTIDSARVAYFQSFTADSCDVEIRWVYDTAIHPPKRAAGSLWDDLTGNSSWRVALQSPPDPENVPLWVSVPFPPTGSWPANMTSHVLLGWISQETPPVDYSEGKAAGHASAHRPKLRLFYH